MAKVAFVGLGVMGFPMGRNLAKKKKRWATEVTVYKPHGPRRAQTHGSRSSAAKPPAHAESRTPKARIRDVLRRQRQRSARPWTLGADGAFAGHEEKGRQPSSISHHAVPPKIAAAELDAAAAKGPASNSVDAPRLRRPGPAPKKRAAAHGSCAAGGPEDAYCGRRNPVIDEGFCALALHAGQNAPSAPSVTGAQDRCRLPERSTSRNPGLRRRPFGRGRGFAPNFSTHCCAFAGVAVVHRSSRGHPFFATGVLPLGKNPITPEDRQKSDF